MSLRIHVFARSQDQYLFPGSIDNKGKRVLDDKGLCKWWRSVLGDAATKVYTEQPGEASLKLHYLLGGCSYLESIPLLAAAATPDDDKAPRWVYCHPYALIPSPLPLPSDGSITLNNLIPAFQDDPKSRYLTSLTSSTISAAGEEGDYDEVMEQLNKLSDSSETLLAMKKAEVEKQRVQERSRLTAVNVDEYWECMGGRQECCSGHVAGFFVVVRDQASKQIEDAAEPPSNTPPKQITPTSATASMPYATYVRLWSAVHNVNYASMAKAAEAYTKWKEDLKSASMRTGANTEEYETEVFGAVKVDNPVVSDAQNSLKRQEPPKAVTTLQVKKKKKVA
jgi:regulator of Ty1 transposition protein 109